MEICFTNYSGILLSIGLWHITLSTVDNKNDCEADRETLVDYCPLHYPR